MHTVGSDCGQQQWKLLGCNGQIWGKATDMPNAHRTCSRSPPPGLCPPALKVRWSPWPAVGDRVMGGGSPATTNRRFWRVHILGAGQSNRR